MIQYENECIDCPTFCMDCGRKHVPHFFCDKCGEEFQPEALYDVEGEMLCGECALLQYKTVADDFSVWLDN